MAQPTSYGLSDFLSTINKAEALARSSRGQEIMRDADLSKPETYAQTLQALGKYGDVQSQKQFIDLANAYESSLNKRKPANSVLPKYESLNPDQMGQFAKQQHDLISIIEEASSNIDESGYPALVQTAEKFGMSNFFPNNFKSFDQNRQSLSQQMALSKKAMNALYSNTKTDEPTNRYVHHEFFGNEPYDPQVNWIKMVPFKFQQDRMNRPSGGYSGNDLSERRFQNLLQQQEMDQIQRQIDKKEKADKEAAREMAESEASSKKAIKSVADSVVKSIGVEETEAEPMIMLLFSKSSIDPYQLSADLQMHLKKKFGQYPNAEDVSAEIKKMIDHLDKKKRMEQDKTPKSQLQKRLESVESLRKSTGE